MSANPVRTVVLIAWAVLAVFPPLSSQAALDESCVVNVLNRTVQVSPQGGWSMPNVPSNMGRIRARATCSRNGETVSGQSDYFNVVQNGIAQVGEIKFEAQEPVPTSVAFTQTGVVTLTNVGATHQLFLRATYPDGSQRDVTAASKGTNYSSTNAAIATVTADGLVTARSSGTVLITARKDEVVAIKQIVVNAAGDADGDGLPDDFEQANGLNPNDAIDAQEDQDGDGLTARREFQLGTNLRVADSDGDGLSDGEEVEAGADGFITNPLNVDTDGDGLRDRIEVLAGSSPTDPNDRNFAEALDRITVTPPSVVLTFNTINTEVSTQLTVTGILIDGSTINLTAKSTGTTYTSSNLNIVSFGLTDGEIFAGQSGDATVTVANSGKQFIVAVKVETFQPRALSAVNIPGYANNVDVAGDYAFIAAGSAGLQVVDVSDRASPAVVASLDTDGTAIDIRVFGNYAYIADGAAGLKIVDISNPLAPTLAAAIDTAGIAQDLKVDSQFAYVADGTNGIEIFDVSNPTQPVAKGQLGGIGDAKGIDAEGSRAVVVSGSSLYVLDVSDREAPAAVGSVSIGPVKDVVMNGNYAYVAAYGSGYRVVNLTNPSAPQITGGTAVIAPRDVELSDGFAFFAEQLFPNVVAYINVQDPEDPVFQGIIDLSAFGDYAGTGIALDGSYAYITEESYVVGQDFGTTGNTRLFIAQYRLISDTAGVAPTIAINKPAASDAVVEGTTIAVDIAAQDDIGVRAVTIAVDGQTIATDTTRPFQVPVAIPFGKADITIAATAIDFGGNTASAQVSLAVLKDTDRDGLGDERETSVHLTNPNDPDSDDDGLEDGQEIALGTNPLSADSDSDGRTDQQEIAAGTDPLNPDVTAPTVAAISPTNGQQNVPENQPVTVTFSELLQPKSVKSDTIKVMLAGNAVAGSVRLMPNGTDVVFTPSGLLNDFTEYLVVVAGVRDLAGNPMAATFQSTYVTGNVVDTTPPQISLSNPLNAATAVPTNAVVTVLMNEPIDPLTVTDTTFFVQDTMGPIGGIGTLSEDGRTLTFVPNAALAVSRQHYVYVYGVKDLFGNQTFTSFHFTSAFNADATAPQIVNTSIVNGQTDVPTNANLQVRFNEAINRLVLTEVQLKQGAAVLSVTRQTTVDGTGSIVEIIPNQPLSANTNYTLSVSGVEDLSGNVLAVSRIVNFTTGAGVDLTAPTLLTRTPISSATGVPLNTQIEAQLSERINPVTVNPNTVRLYNNTTGQFVSGVASLSADSTAVKFTPAVPLTANQSYHLYVTYSTYVEDLAGNRINTGWNFTTGTSADTTAPQVALQSIADGATGIVVNGRMVLQFDAPLADRCVNAQTVQMRSGGTPIAGTLTLSTDRTQLTFTPQQPLSVSTAYTLTLQGLCDLAGNVLGNFTSSFTTSASATADTTGPTVTITPAQGATNVPVGTAVTITFSEPIDVTTLAGGTQVTVSGLSGEVAGNLTVNGNVATFTPLNAFPGNKQIVATVNGVRDLAGNQNSFRSNSFTTGVGNDATAPQVLSITPNDGMLDVAPGTPIVLTFSESLNASTVSNDTFALFVNGAIVSPSVSRSQDNRTVILTANLPASSVVSVIVTDDVQDLSGNALVDYVSAFTTAVGVDTGRPSVVTQFPGSGANGVLPDASVVLYTNEPLDTGTIEQALHISQNGVLVAGTVTSSGNGQVITFRPNQPWARSGLVEVFLDNTARDVEGNALNNYQGSFRVATDPQTNGPSLVSSQPAYSSTTPVNPVIDLLFDEALDPSTVNTTNVALRNYSTGQLLARTVSLIKAGRVIRVTPQAVLAANEDYYVEIPANTIRDLNGQMTTRVFLYFLTNAVTVADTQAPRMLAISPANGATAVALNAHVHARFDESVNPISLLNDAQQTTYGSLFWGDSNREVLFVRHEPYAPATQVTESLASLLDYAGNSLVAPNSTTFTTGNTPDLSDPQLLEITPSNGATNVPVNAVVRVRFNEQIDPASVNPSTTYVYDAQRGVNVTGSATLEADGRTLTFVPDQAYLVGRLHYVYTYGVRDLSGNQLFTTRSFTTAFATDTQAPTVTQTSVAEGQTAVPTNATLQVRFDEPVNTLTLAGVNLRLDGQTVPASLIVSGDRRTVTFKLVQPLSANTSYTLNVSGVEDLSGNVLASNRIVGFTTGSGADLTPPTVLTRTPVSSATGVPLNTQIEAQLSERINPVTVNPDTVRLYNNTTGQFVAGVASVSADGTAVRFTPAAPLTANQSYHYYVTYSEYVEDLAGNRINNGWNFTTGTSTDAVAPQVLMQSIANGATGIPVNGRMVLQFDAALADRCVNGQTVQITNAGTPINGTLTLSTDRTQLTFTPQQPLSVNTAYTLQLQGLCDLAGNVLGTLASSFTTSASATADTTGPTVTISPAQGATGVPVSTAVTITFSEPIDVTTLAGGTQVTVSGLSGEVAGNLTVNGNVVTFTPLNAFPGNKQIGVVVNGVRDLAGNQNSFRSVSFTTGAGTDATAPQVLSITPNDGTLDVAPGTPIVLTFSESLNASTVNNDTFALFVNGAIVTPSVSRSQDNRTVILTASLPASSVVSVLVTDAVQDLSGNAVADYVSAFTTAVSIDTGRPSVVTQFPGSGANGVLPDASIVLYANEPLDTGTVEQALHVSQNGVLVAGTVTTGGNGQVITFRPDQPWARSALVEVFLNNTARDVEGNALNNYQGNFRIGADPRVNVPTLVATQPSYGTNTAPVNPVIDLQFSEALDPATVNATTVELRNYSSGQVLARTVSLIKAGRVIRVAPQAVLAANEDYYVQIAANAVRDLDGQAASSVFLYFVTNAVAVADTQAPHMLAIGPSNGATAVPVNAHVHARFDESINPIELLNDTQQVTVGSLFWGDNNREVRFVRHEPYAPNTQVTEMLAGLLDYAGNSLTAPNSTTFTTGNTADVSDPQLVEITPSSGATNVPVNAVVRVRFNEQIDPASINPSTSYVYDAQQGMNLAGTATLEADGRTLTFVPNQAYLAGRQHYVYTYGVRDLSGNQLFTTRSFTTAFAADTQAPLVMQTSVSDGQTGVPTNASLQVQFDEPVSPLTLDAVVLRVGAQTVPASLIVSGDRRTLTFKLVQPLAANTSHTLSVSGVQDLSGNVQTVNRTVVFTTGAGADLDVPTLLTRTPASNATGVPRNIQVEAQLNERINPLSVNPDSVRLYNNSTGQFVAGVASVSADGTVVRFTPAALLTANQSYHYYVTYSTYVEDLAGNRINTGWNFTTGAQ